MLGLLLAASLLATGWLPQSAQVHDTLDRAIATFPAHRAVLERKFGPDQTIDLGVQLVSDEAALSDPVPNGLTQAAWHEALLTTARGDLEMLSRALAWQQPQLRNEPGLHAGFAQSPIDGLWEPLAVYVPPHHAEHPPVAIVIHGRPQTEMELLGPSYFRALADSTGTVLVAPWGRGIYDFEGVAGSDVTALVPLAQRTFGSDARQTYLVGYSMGGFSVFKIGPKSQWAGVMCISGSMLNSEVTAIRFAWRTTPVYVVNGSNDAVIPPIDGMQTAVFLDSMGIPTSFYQQPGGSHSIRTLMPQLARAWSDMHLGIVRQQSIPQLSARANFLAAPPSLPNTALKP
jgi:S-formylglutathione hydrolase FrmB